MVGINQDITEHKRQEQKILRYNQVLEGINRIFSNVVQAKTEEDLGNVCLSVALELTGSLIGFVNLVGDDGLMHDIAISEGGWDRCLMYDKTGHRRPPGDFVLHGLYGRVFDSGKGFFTNKPLSHPDSIGLPYGHPPINSFLGAPLVLDGKTMGVIAVADRDGGYGHEQQENLEAIASAMIQALHRKRSEEALLKAYEQIQMQSEELKATNEELRAQSAELKEANEALQKSEESYRMLFTSMTEAFLLGEVICDNDGKPYDYIFLDANPAYELHTGVKKERILGRSALELFPDASLKAIKKYGEVALSGQPTNFEFFSQALNRYLDVYVFSPEQGKFAVIFTDITERKKAEEALLEAYEKLQIESEELQAADEELQAQSEELQAQTEELGQAYQELSESEKRYRLLFNNSMDAIILTDPQGSGKILSVNPAACQMLGWSKKS